MKTANELKKKKKGLIDSTDHNKGDFHAESGLVIFLLLVWLLITAQSQQGFHITPPQVSLPQAPCSGHPLPQLLRQGFFRFFFKKSETEIVL